jgi:hypothetical protein
VRVGDRVTRYVRRGSGPSVLLLGAESESGPMWRAIIEWLGSNRRITIPQAPSDPIEAIEWLRGFVEGLGLTGFDLIAAPEFHAAALELATADDFTVHKLVLLPTQDSVAELSSSRVLSILPEWSLAEASRRVETFLSTEE